VSHSESYTLHPTPFTALFMHFADLTKTLCPTPYALRPTPLSPSKFQIWPKPNTLTLESQTALSRYLADLADEVDESGPAPDAGHKPDPDRRHASAVSSAETAPSRSHAGSFSSKDGSLHSLHVTSPERKMQTPESPHRKTHTPESPATSAGRPPVHPSPVMKSKNMHQVIGLQSPSNNTFSSATKGGVLGAAGGAILRSESSEGGAVMSAFSSGKWSPLSASVSPELAPYNRPAGVDGNHLEGVDSLDSLLLSGSGGSSRASTALMSGFR
jgi:hypothetical protein